MFTRRSTLLGRSGAARGAWQARRMGERAGVIGRCTAISSGATGRRSGSARGAYHYAGTNMWYAPWLGADAPFGNRARLARELDRLRALGVSNVRINGSAEFSPLRNSVRPAFRGPAAIMTKPCSAASISPSPKWAAGDEGGDLPDQFLGMVGRDDDLSLLDQWRPLHQHERPGPSLAGIPRFRLPILPSPPAVAMYHDYIRAVVTRTNSITGRRYVDDPAIMAWQLANEPRPGGSDAVGTPNLPAFYAWVRATARLIKSLDPNHLVSTGSEGLKGCLESAACVTDRARSPRSTISPPMSGRKIGAGSIPPTSRAPGRAARSWCATMSASISRSRRGSASPSCSRNSASRARAAASTPPRRPLTRTVITG